MASSSEQILKHTILIGDYDVEIFDGKLGKGSYGTVHKSTNRKTGELCAAKQIDVMISGDIKQNLLERTESELEILRRLQDHENIVKLYDIRRYKNCHFIFMEYCQYGSLMDYVLVNENIPLLDRFSIERQCASAIAFMHEQVPIIIHRDLKLENILITKVGTEVHAKISDFGLSKILDELTDSKMKTHLGTKYYMAPELFGHIPYDKSVDVFSLGLVFLVLGNLGEEDQLVMIPMSAQSRKRRCTGIYLGEEMWRCHENKTPMPDIFFTFSKDTSLRKHQELVISMTQYASDIRPEMKSVESAISNIMAEYRISSDTLLDDEMKMTTRKQFEYRKASAHSSCIADSADDSAEFGKVSSSSASASCDLTECSVSNIKAQNSLEMLEYLQLKSTDPARKRKHSSSELTTNDPSVEKARKSDPEPENKISDKVLYEKATKVTQAVIDRSFDAIISLLKDETVKDWVSILVSKEDLENHGLPDPLTHITAIGYASYKSPLAVVRSLVEAGAQLYNVDCFGNSVLHYVPNDHIDTLDKAKYFVECDKGLLCARSNDNTMPIHEAAQNNEKDVLAYYIELGVSVDSPGQNNAVPAMFAALGGHFDCIKFLENHTANVQATDSRDCNILHFACNAGQNDCVQKIIDSYVRNVNSMSKMGSPLHFAVLCGHLDTVKLLCSYTDCDLSLPGPVGVTAAVLALIQGELEIYTYLNKLEDDYKYRLAVRQNFVLLKTEINVSDYLDELFQENVLEISDVRKLEAMENSEIAARDLLYKLFDKTNLNWGEIFTASLKKHNPELHARLHPEME